MITTADFYGTRVSRLVLGDNPFIGNSYVHEMYGGNEMLDYYTSDTVVRALFEAQDCGINTYMALADQFILRSIRQFRREGGKMNLIFQTYPAADLEANIVHMMAYDPIAIYHQGSTLDLMVEENNFDLLFKRLEMIKKTGVKTGLGTHEPETLLKAEREKWGMDFYATCLYNSRRENRGGQSSFLTGKPKHQVFYPGDPPLMYEAIRAVEKPCIAFKLFAGGQVFAGKPQDETPRVVEKVFGETFDGIKPCDLTCVGVFQKYKNQIRENAEIAGKVLAAAVR